MNVAREEQGVLTDGCPPLQFICFRNWPWSSLGATLSKRRRTLSHSSIFLVELWLRSVPYYRYSSDPLLERKLSAWVLFLGFSTYLPCSAEPLCAPGHRVSARPGFRQLWQLKIVHHLGHWDLSPGHCTPTWLILLVSSMLPSGNQAWEGHFFSTLN